MATQTLTQRQSDASVTPPEPIEPLAGGNLETTMNGAMLLQHAAGVIEHRRASTAPRGSCSSNRIRWSLVLGRRSRRRRWRCASSI